MRGDPAPPRAPMPRHRASHQKKKEKNNVFAQMVGAFLNSSSLDCSSFAYLVRANRRKKQHAWTSKRTQIKKPGRLRSGKLSAQQTSHFLGQRHSLVLHSFSWNHEGVKHMNEITTLTVRLPREDKETLMKYAEDHDLSASQIVRQLIRKYLFHCNILQNY